MAALEVTSRQLREKQKSFFDMAGSGAQAGIRRGRRQACALTPVGLLPDETYHRLKKVRAAWSKSF
jgi:hypothetical protein